MLLEGHVTHDGLLPHFSNLAGQESAPDYFPRICLVFNLSQTLLGRLLIKHVTTFTLAI